MKSISRTVALACLSLTAGCNSADHAVFVTVTDIGINADATAEQVNIGYNRSEGFSGPVYVEKGAVPQVVGYLQSNLEVFSPKVKQLYATGTAAGLVTQVRAPDSGPAAERDATGRRRVMFFGTSSTIGLGLAFAGGAPDSIHFGYHRKELSVIPFLEKDPSGTTKDIYASTLASIDIGQTTSTPTKSGLGISQFIATGAAAENLARHDEIRAIFRQAATTATARGYADAQVLRDDAKSIATCISSAGGALDAPASARLGKILDSAVKNGLQPENASILRQATTTDELNSLLTDVLQTAGPILKTTIQKDPALCDQ